MRETRRKPLKPLSRSPCLLLIIPSSPCPSCPERDPVEPGKEITRNLDRACDPNLPTCCKKLQFYFIFPFIFPKKLPEVLGVLGAKHWASLEHHSPHFTPIFPARDEILECHEIRGGQGSGHRCSSSQTHSVSHTSDLRRRPDREIPTSGSETASIMQPVTPSHYHVDWNGLAVGLARYCVYPLRFFSNSLLNTRSSAPGLTD